MTINQPLLQTIATSDPDWPSFSATLPPALLATQPPIPNQLAKDITDLLRKQRPELTPYLDSPPPSNMQTLNAIPTLLTIGTILFLLRTSITFQRSESGKISFNIAHTGMDNELVTKIVEALKDWLPKSS